ncbi:MAG TPA: hypothetical protein G4N96_02215 [Chloroflexi bacterium]|nr:hypothetical protein [Chloroflexota bacterium]
MKLTLSIVNNEDARLLLDALSKKGHHAMLLNAIGGVLQENKAIILAGVAENALNEVLALIKDICPTRVQYTNFRPPVMEPGEIFAPEPAKKEEAGAVVYVLDVAQFHQF